MSDTNVLTTYLDSRVDFAKAKEAMENAKMALDQSYQQEYLAKGFGKNAVVSHVHADAHHGNGSTKVVQSRVVNVHACQNGVAHFRIQLGRANGKGLSDQYASVACSRCTLVQSSNEEFGW